MDLDATVRAAKQALHKISPKIAPYEIRSLDTMVLDSTWRVRYSMLLLIALSGVALVMAAFNAVRGRWDVWGAGVGEPQ